MTFWRFIFLCVAIAIGLFAIAFRDKIVPAVAAAAQIEDVMASSMAAPQPRVFACRAPVYQGEFVVVTIAWQDGALVGECDYLINQLSYRKLNKP